MEYQIFSFSLKSFLTFRILISIIITTATLKNKRIQKACKYIATIQHPTTPHLRLKHEKGVLVEILNRIFTYVGMPLLLTNNYQNNSRVFKSNYLSTTAADFHFLYRKPCC